VVVVSEEKGAVSYAYKGHLVRGVTAEELRAFLTSVFIRRPKRSAREWIRKRLHSRKTQTAGLSAAISEPHSK